MISFFMDRYRILLLVAAFLAPSSCEKTESFEADSGQVRLKFFLNVNAAINSGFVMPEESVSWRNDLLNLIGESGGDLLIVNDGHFEIGFSHYPELVLAKSKISQSGFSDFVEYTK